MAFGAWLLAVAIGIPAGNPAALRQGSTADEASRLAALAGVATPDLSAPGCSSSRSSPSNWGGSGSSHQMHRC
ncbi:MAG: hypothetical protein U5K37_02055 [Natrialbaceae archaeon]|nr:hypothetical protein [Natrialbaceae archaeon]